MSDTTYETFQHYGTNAQRLAFTPSPAAGIKPIYIWYESDTNNVYIYTTGWHIVAGAGAGAITALTGDVTASGPGSAAATIANDAVTYAKMQNVSATARVLGRNTAGAGNTEEVTLTQLLDFVGSAAQGDILYRNATVWVRLPAGTSGDVLTSGGAGANPSWVTPGGGGGSWTTTFKTSDQSKASDNTRAADPVLKVTMLANTKYSIRGTLFVTAGAGGFFGKFSGPASPTVLATMRWIIDGTGTSFTNIKHDSAYAQDFSTGTDCMMRFEILIHNGANAGDLTIDWAQGTVDVTNTTMRAGSYIEYHQL